MLTFTGPFPFTSQAKAQTPDARTMINEAVAEIAAKYPDMFKPSQNCRSPHVNVDVCRDNIFQSEFITTRGITNTEALVAAIEQANTALGKELQDPLTGKKKTAPAKKDKALEKAIQYNFFLGLDSTWMHRDFE